MNLNMLRLVIMSLDYFSAFMLFLILLSCAWEKNKTMLLRIFMGMSAACVVSVLLEAISLSLSFSGVSGNASLRMILNNISIVCGYGLSFLYACYVVNLVGVKHRLCSLTLKALRMIGCMAVCLLIVGHSLGLLFTLSDEGIQPHKFFVLIFAFDLLACMAGILLIILYRRSLKAKDIIALLSLPGFIFIAAVVQYMVFNMMYGLFLMAASALFIIYLMIQTDRNKLQIEQEKRIMDMNVALMRSQIQPHFLYNALSSIRRMIKKDPEVAERAVENFSQYLRQNLESMNRTEPISFATELKHLEEYLYLEKLRFGDRLQVLYDIPYKEFVLPVLTLQPIVENAVKHGIMKREDGGTIWIKTRREGKNVVLTIEDNGVGFDTNAVMNSARMHIGFENVKKRFEVQCRGTVTVASKPGVGTTVTIVVPLE